MFEVANLKKRLKKYNSIFSNILFGLNLENIEGNKMIFKDYSRNQMIATVTNNIITFYYQNLNYERQIELELPNKDTGEDIKVKEFIKETRQNGTIIEKIERTYGFSNYSHKERTLVDLVSERYVFDKNIQISDINKCVHLSLMKTIFECRMLTLVKQINSVRWYTDTPYSTHTILNNQDISYVYDVVNGIDKIARIYDLYNGVINERNENDIFGIHLGLIRKECLGYKEVSGITKKEDSICGKSKEKLYINQNPEFIHQLLQNRIGYKKNFSCDNLNSLIEAITYRKTSTELAKECIEKKLGIPYDEFDALDHDEQRKIIREYHKKNPSKISKDVPVMLGSGEHKIIVKVKKGEKVMLSDGRIIEAGLTPEEEKQRLEEKLDAALYGKPIAFMKKIRRKIKNFR